MSKTNNRPFVVYWNNIPAPYMVERFNALADRKNFDFEAWFNDRSEFDRSWEVDESSWRFKYRYLPSLKIGRFKIRFPLPLLVGRRPDVLTSLYAEPVFVLGWFLAKFRKIKTMFRVLVTFDSWVIRKNWSEVLKKYIFSHVDGIETPGHDGRKFALRYGASKNKIHIVSHAVDVSHFSNKSKKAMIYRSKIRNILGLKGLTFIYVGRLLSEKGLNYLLDAFRDLQTRYKKQINLLLVGNGKDSDLLKKRCQKEKIYNVIFAGFWQKNDLPFLYAASDIFVFPTLGDPYGLVVNEAMACSLPVISTDTAGEIESRIKHGTNGFIVPSKSSTELSERMEELGKNTALRKKMGGLSLKKVADLSPEKWAIDFENAINNLV